MSGVTRGIAKRSPAQPDAKSDANFTAATRGAKQKPVNAIGAPRQIRASAKEQSATNALISQRTFVRGAAAALQRVQAWSPSL